MAGYMEQAYQVAEKIAELNALIDRDPTLSQGQIAALKQKITHYAKEQENFEKKSASRRSKNKIIKDKTEHEKEEKKHQEEESLDAQQKEEEFEKALDELGQKIGEPFQELIDLFTGEENLENIDGLISSLIKQKKREQEGHEPIEIDSNNPFKLTPALGKKYLIKDKDDPEHFICISCDIDKQLYFDLQDWKKEANEKDQESSKGLFTIIIEEKDHNGNPHHAEVTLNGQGAVMGLKEKDIHQEQGFSCPCMHFSDDKHTKHYNTHTHELQDDIKEKIPSLAKDLEKLGIDPSKFQQSNDHKVTLPSNIPGRNSPSSSIPHL